MPNQKRFGPIRVVWFKLAHNEKLERKHPVIDGDRQIDGLSNQVFLKRADRKSVV